MQSQSQNAEIVRIAKLAVMRPEVLVTELLDGGAEYTTRVLHALRAYPDALVRLSRADNISKATKSDIEMLLDEVGFQILT